MATLSVALSAEPLPARLAGSWRITRILPTHNISCWDEAQARQLVGTTLHYSAHSLRWHGGQIALQGIVMREITAEEFTQENSGSGGYDVTFAMLGIRARSVIEVDLQHEDADVIEASTAVPGDSVLLAGPNRIIVSACGVFFDATRLPAH